MSDEGRLGDEQRRGGSQWISWMNPNLQSLLNLRDRLFRTLMQALDVPEKLLPENKHDLWTFLAAMPSEFLDCRPSLPTGESGELDDYDLWGRTEILEVQASARAALEYLRRELQPENLRRRQEAQTRQDQIRSQQLDVQKLQLIVELEDRGYDLHELLTERPRGEDERLLRLAILEVRHQTARRGRHQPTPTPASVPPPRGPPPTGALPRVVPADVAGLTDAQREHPRNTPPLPIGAPARQAAPAASDPRHLRLSERGKGPVRSCVDGLLKRRDRTKRRRRKARRARQRARDKAVKARGHERRLKAARK